MPGSQAVDLCAVGAVEFIRQGACKTIVGLCSFIAMEVPGPAEASKLACGCIFGFVDKRGVLAEELGEGTVVLMERKMREEVRGLGGFISGDDGDLRRTLVRALVLGLCVLVCL